MTPRRATSWWLERALFTCAFALGLWALLAAAQSRFYAALPIPSHAAIALLPGEGADGGHDMTPATTASISPLKPGDWVARLEAPSVGLEATVIEGSSNRMLARAAGHIEYTPLPGAAGNVGIAGHRDTTFRPVRHLEVGDTLILRTATAIFHYEVERTFVVDPTDVRVLDPTSRPSLTLVTCYPFTFVGHAPQRYIVRAVLRDEHPAARADR